MSSTFGYTGEIVDDNGLVYLRARYYSPDLEIFISQDAYEGTTSNPMSLNRYAYADSNPVNNTDPSGMIPCSNSPFSLPTFLNCIQQVFGLARDFGISLMESDGLSESGQGNWTPQRVQNVHSAVQAMNARLGGDTRRAIGDLSIRLEAQSPGAEAARTTLCNVMSLFLNFSGASDHVHTVDNLIHEFGHVITLSPPVGRTTNSEAIGPAVEMANRPVALWGQIQNYRGFGEQRGWRPNLRQSPSDTAAEVVADMFLHWVQGYPFTPDGQFIGQTRSTFMNGGTIPGRDGNPLSRINDNTPINDGSIISSGGITAWAGNTSCAGTAGSNAGNSSLATDPYLLAANSGWCVFT